MRFGQKILRRGSASVWSSESWENLLEKQKIPSRQFLTNCWDRRKLPVVPPGLTQILRPLNTYTAIRRPLITESLAPSHILQETLFPIAFRSPFNSIVSCRNPTACGSLEESFWNLLTLLQRFNESIAHKVSRVNGFPKFFPDFFRIAKFPAPALKPGGRLWYNTRDRRRSDGQSISLLPLQLAVSHLGLLPAGKVRREGLQGLPGRRIFLPQYRRDLRHRRLHLLLLRLPAADAGEPPGPVRGGQSTPP